MKVLVVDEALCAGYGNCEEVCSKTWFKEANREKSCIRMTPTNEGYSLNVCNQCGECITVCPVEALYRDKRGIVRLNAEECIGCLSCVGFCPTQSMFTAAGVDKPFKCISCGVCVKECPSGALKIVDDAVEPIERVFYRRHQ